MFETPRQIRTAVVGDGTKIQKATDDAASQAGRVKAEPFPPPAAIR